jgi:hypothetical protein
MQLELMPDVIPETPTRGAACSHSKSFFLKAAACFGENIFAQPGYLITCLRKENEVSGIPLLVSVFEAWCLGAQAFTCYSERECGKI